MKPIEQELTGDILDRTGHPLCSSSVWQPSEAERIAIAAGGAIVVMVWGEMPAVALAVADAPPKPTEEGGHFHPPWVAKQVADLVDGALADLRQECDGSGGFGSGIEGVLGWRACQGCVNCRGEDAGESP